MLHFINGTTLMWLDNLCVSDMTIHYKTAFIGKTMYLECGDAAPENTSVTWQRRREMDDTFDVIVSGGILTNSSYSGHFDISGNTMIINNIQTNDTGFYICGEDSGLGEEHYISFSAVYGNLVGKSLTSYFYRATLCISTVFAVGRCPSVRLSVCRFR